MGFYSVRVDVMQQSRSGRKTAASRQPAFNPCHTHPGVAGA